ncbi:MAG: sigma-70 family RNA polymerase sigma factor [Gemmatimonadetes bacterium]|jgi:RNA polymerase sigma-70 factor, ECF subfamily|nr:sigma-70 family RNA polymerase sigma factor [Gemmatimonadota bacterium]
MEAVKLPDAAALVAAARTGGPEAFAPIVERYKDAVFGVAFARLRRFHEAEDTAQDAFVRAYGSIDGLKDPAKLGPWLRSIALRCALDAIERRKDTLALEDIDEPAAPEPTPLEAVERDERRELVQDAIGRLPKTQRETLTLFYLGGHSIKEIAALREAPEGTVKRRLHDARQRLKEDMLQMVEDVLQEEAPKEDFAARVYELVSSYGKGPTNPWDEARFEQVRAMAGTGFAGFVKAMASPHWRTRRDAVMMIDATWPEHLEESIEMLKQALQDPNKQVRGSAGDMLLNEVDVSDERKRREFVPLIVPQLRDRSRGLRYHIAPTLERWAADVPLEEVAQAIVEEEDDRNLRQLKVLMGCVLDAQRAEQKLPPMKVQEIREKYG